MTWHVLRLRLASLAGRASFVCWLCGHAEAVHEVTKHGCCWVCPDCRRWHRSVVRRHARVL